MIEMGAECRELAPRLCRLRDVLQKHIKDEKLALDVLLELADTEPELRAEMARLAVTYLPPARLWGRSKS